MNPKGLKKTFHLACRDNICHLHSVIVRNLRQPTRWGGVGRTLPLPAFLSRRCWPSFLLCRAEPPAQQRGGQPATPLTLTTWSHGPYCPHVAPTADGSTGLPATFFLFLFFFTSNFPFLNAGLSAQRHLGVPPGPPQKCKNFVQSNGRKLLRYEMSFCPAGPVDNISSSSNFSNYLPSS